jgi:filamentous hemagglutinin family protein
VLELPMVGRLKNMKILRRFYTSLFLAACLTTGAMSLPEGATVVNGNVNITTNGGTQTITQSTNQAIVNWNGFNIDMGELVHFVQPSSVSAILNRVVGQDPSQILGAMRANGQVFLINPNGVVFGENAVIDVGSLVVSTLNITDDDFLQGKLNFQQEADHELASIINHGTIKIDDNGYVVLTGPMVANEGVILARVGQVALAGGTKSTVSFDPTGMIQLELPTDSLSSDGIVSLSQSDTSDLLSSVVSSGSAPAGQIVERDGRTFLEVASGTVVNTGDIVADGMAGEDAGRVILDSTSNTYLASGATITAAGQGENSAGGDVFVLSDEQAITELGSQIDVSGGTSGDAGFAEQSAHTGVVGVTVDMGAENGEAGTFLVDPDRAIVGTSGVAPPGSMFYFESVIESQPSGTFALVADDGVDFETLLGGELTLQSGVHFTIDLIAAGGDGTDAITFQNPGDQIRVSGGGDFTLNSATGTALRDLQIVSDDDSRITLWLSGEDIVGSSSFINTGTGTTRIFNAGAVGTELLPVTATGVFLSQGTGDLYVHVPADSTLNRLGGENVTVTGSGDIILQGNSWVNDTITYDVTGTINGSGNFIAPTLDIKADKIGDTSFVSFDATDVTVEANEIWIHFYGTPGDLTDIVLTNPSDAFQADTRFMGNGTEIFWNQIRYDNFPTSVLGTVTADAGAPTNITFNGAGRINLDNPVIGGNLTLVSSGTANDAVFGDVSSIGGNTSLTGDSINLTGANGPLTAVATAGDVDINIADNPFEVGGSATGDFNLTNNGTIGTHQITATNIDIEATGGGRNGNSIIQFDGTLDASNSVTLAATGSVGSNGGPGPIQTDAPVLVVTAPDGIHVDDVGGNVTSATFDDDGGGGFINFSTTGNATVDSVNGTIASFFAPNGALDITATTRFVIDAEAQSIAINSTQTRDFYLLATNGDATVSTNANFAIIEADVTGGNLSYTNTGGGVDVFAADATGNVTLDTQGRIQPFVESEEPARVTGNVVTLSGTEIEVNVDAQRVNATASAGDVDLFSEGANLVVDAQATGGSVIVQSNGNLAHGTINADNGVDLSTQAGDVTRDSGRITASSVTLQGNNVEAETDASTISATAPGNVSVTNFSPVVDLADVSAGGDVSFTTPGTANINTFTGANLALDVGQSITGDFVGGTVSLTGTTIDATVTADDLTAVARDGDATVTSSGNGLLTVTDSSASGDFELNHGGNVEFNRIEAQNVLINAGGDIVDTENTIIASGITLNGNNVFVNTQGQVIVINAQGDVTVSNTLVDVDSLTIDSNGTVTFDTDGNLTIASVAGGPLVDLTAGANISAAPNAVVSATDVILTVGGNITPDLDNPLDVQATNTITVNAPGAGFQGQGAVSPSDIAAALIGIVPAEDVAVIAGSGPVYYNGILLNGIIDEVAPPDVVLPTTVVENEIAFQNSQVIDDGSVGSAANDGIVEQSPTQELVAQLTEAAGGASGGGEGMPTTMLITLEVDALGEVQVSLSEPSPFDATIENSEELTADDVLDLDTDELTDVKVGLYYDPTNDQLIMAIDMHADDIIDLDVSDYELIPVQLDYSFLSDPSLILENLRANDLIDLHVEDLGDIPIRVHVEGRGDSAQR